MSSMTRMEKEEKAEELAIKYKEVYNVDSTSQSLNLLEIEYAKLYPNRRLDIKRAYEITGDVYIESTKQPKKDIKSRKKKAINKSVLKQTSVDKEIVNLLDYLTSNNIVGLSQIVNELLLTGIDNNLKFKRLAEKDFDFKELLYKVNTKIW